MNIVVGKLAGFCGGVINSVRKTEELLDKYNTLYCLGELVHNKQVVDKLEAKGLVVVNSIDEVPDGNKLIIRAHGIAKEVYEEAFRKKIELFDLTCPNVLTIHDKAKRLVGDNCFVVLIAKKDHPEAIGTISFCGDDSIILEDNNEVDYVIEKILATNKKKIAIISQTTFSMKKFESISFELKDRLNDYEVFIDNTICSATELRQKETEKLSEIVEAMIVIGGRNSSNTKKLFEIANKKCDCAFIVETFHDLKDDMSKFNSIGVMAGASTPKESVDEVIEYLESLN
jgi:4-hydroxy-3-methylbut-2-enyl diphosphate reductase